jgi:hypothetical protein
MRGRSGMVRGIVRGAFFAAAVALLCAVIATPQQMASAKAADISMSGAITRCLRCDAAGYSCLIGGYADECGLCDDPYTRAACTSNWNLYNVSRYHHALCENCAANVLNEFESCDFTRWACDVCIIPN